MFFHFLYFLPTLFSLDRLDHMHHFETCFPFQSKNMLHPVY